MADAAGCCERTMANDVAATRGSVPVVGNFAVSLSKVEAARLEKGAARNRSD